MVVLAASICTRGGKAIISRQFRDLHKERVAALLANFPKLAQSGTQHTTVEDDNVRYVYQPLEELYVVLITNRQSNILQDIETLRLLSQVVSSSVRTVDEREVLHNAFDLLAAFDEVVTLGYRENLSLSQIKTFLEMESHEEKIQEIIERNKELEAAEERKKKAKQLELQRREASRRTAQRLGPASTGGFGSSSRSGGFGPSSIPSRPAPTVYDYVDTQQQQPTSTFRSQPRGKGLQLGKKKTSSGVDALREEAESSPLLQASVDEPEPVRQVSADHRLNGRPVSNNTGVEVNVVEGIKAKFSRDGTIKSSEIQGNLKLRIGDPNLAKLKIVTTTDAAAFDTQYKTNPKVDKEAFLTHRAIVPKNLNIPFPTNNTEFEVLRWRINGKPEDSSLVPVTFNCWFARSDPGFFDVTLEYELKPDYTEKLDNVVITVPLVSSNAHITDPSLVFDQTDDHIEWIIPEIVPGTSSVSGSFEFTAEADSENDFFPMQVTFKVLDPTTTYGRVDVSEVVSATDESVSYPFRRNFNISADSYTIE